MGVVCGCIRNADMYIHFTKCPIITDSLHEVCTDSIMKAHNTALRDSPHSAPSGTGGHS